MKVGSKNQRLGVGLIKISINAFNFELGLMDGANRAFLGMTPPNGFCAYFFDKHVRFVQSNMSETCLSVIGHLLMM